eukprot:gene14912-20061_t
MSNHPPSHITKKSTIIKDRVGCVKTSAYSLPPPSHTFGKKTDESPEGVGDIISNWTTANPSEEEKAKKIVVQCNVLAIKHGCITARAMREYNIAHPNIRLVDKVQNNSSRVSANHEGPFGIKTKFSEDTMEDILQAKFTDFSNEDADYPSVHSIKKTGSMPVPRTTIAAQSIIAAREQAEEKGQPKHFIMKRFQNIPGKLKLELKSASPGKKINEFEETY